MNTRTNYEQLAAKVDYAALEKKLTQLAQADPPKRRKTIGDILEPVREHLLALHGNGWTSLQLVAELKAAGLPVSPARLRECLNRWTSGHNGGGKRRVRRPSQHATAAVKPPVAASPPARNRSISDVSHPKLGLSYAVRRRC